MSEAVRMTWLRHFLRVLSLGYLVALIPWITLILLNAPILAPGGALAPLLRFQPYNAYYESMMAAIHIAGAHTPGGRTIGAGGRETPFGRLSTRSPESRPCATGGRGSGAAVAPYDCLGGAGVQAPGRRLNCSGADRPQTLLRTAWLLAGPDSEVANENSVDSQ